MATTSGFLEGLHPINLPPDAYGPSMGDTLHREGEDVMDFDQISRLGLDGYRIALIPSEEHLRDARAGLAKRKSALILPLTWKQLLALASGQTGDQYTGRNANAFQFGEIHINFESMEVRRGDSTVVLTCMEFKLLKFLVLNPSRVIPRAALLSQVWGYNSCTRTRTVDNHVLRLRRKLESNVSRPVHFKTVHGVGYKFIPNTQTGSGRPARCK